MLHNTANKITSALTNDLDNNKAIPRATYSLEVILTDLSKFIIMFFIFSVFDLHDDFLIITLFSAMLRLYAGGFHLSNYYSCLLFTSIYVSAVMYLGNLVHLAPSPLLVAAFIIITILGIIAPVIPIKKQKYTENNKGRFKTLTLLIASLLITIAYISESTYAQYAFWVVGIQTLLLIFAKWRNRHDSKVIKAS